MSYGTVQAEKMTTESGYSLGAGNSSSFKNRFINGAMVIDQRNNGASVTPTSSAYTVDRWQAVCSVASKFSIQQNAGSVTPPSGFVNYTGCTITSAYTVTANDFFLIGQRIEGFNTADWRWGTASAQTVTLSCWVRSSLTGTFGGVVGNGNTSRSYPFTFNIPSANTWTLISVTIPGDVTGLWNINANQGVVVWFSLGSGSNYAGTAGSWVSANLNGATGQNQVVQTNGATFYFTGAQIELGTVATSFDYRPFGTEFQLCQRYYEVGGNNAPTQVEGGGTNVWISIQYKVTKRADPTIGLTSASNLALRYYGTAGYAITGAAFVTGYIGTTSAMVRYSGFGGLTTSAVMFTSGTTDPTPTVDPFSISAEL
jgi:hypothetical protein